MKAFRFVVASLALAFLGVAAGLAQRVEILSASYGIGDYRVDVTERVRQLAAGSEGFEVSSRALGLPPVPLPGKQLTVVYAVGGRQFRETVQEGETFHFRAASRAEEEEMDRGERRGPRVVRARYGRAGEYTDVTEEVRRYAQRGESFRVSPEAFGMEPAESRGGQLRVTLMDRRGERVQRVYEEGDYVDFR